MKRKVICILILIILIGLLIFKLNNDASIDFFALRNDGAIFLVKNTKYRITNQEELEMFYTHYHGFKLPKNYDLTKNTIFIQIRTESSGSTKVNLKGVSIDKEIKFKVSTHGPTVGTANLAYWYLVAIIPNTKLNGVNVDEWKSPIDVKK